MPAAGRGSALQRNSFLRGMSAPRREQVMAAALAAKPNESCRFAADKLPTSEADNAWCSASQVSSAA